MKLTELAKVNLIIQIFPFRHTTNGKKLLLLIYLSSIQNITNWKITLKP